MLWYMTWTLQKRHGSGLTFQRYVRVFYIFHISISVSLIFAFVLVRDFYRSFYSLVRSLLLIRPLRPMLTVRGNKSKITDSAENYVLFLLFKVCNSRLSGLSARWLKSSIRDRILADMLFLFHLIFVRAFSGIVRRLCLLLLAVFSLGNNLLL